MDTRKQNILIAVVEAYIRTGEPVGSKGISKLPQISVSAATVRNDMAVLEELGYLEQPHTSAGRVPTYLGYRFYIDHIAQQETLPTYERERLDAMLGEEANLTEELLIQSATTALSEITKCATVVTDFAPRYSVISKVEVIPTGKRLYVVLLITSNGTIKNKACRLEFDLTEEQMMFFRTFMQEHLQGVSISDLSDSRFEQMATALGAYMVALSPLVKGISEMSRDLQQHKVYVRGEKNLLACQDLNQMEVVDFISHKDELNQLLDDAFHGIKVMFGSEGDNFVIGNSSMIVSKYQKGKQTVGSLGIIGPMRLDYAKVIPYIEYFTEKLSRLMTDTEDTDSIKEEFQ